MTADRSVPSTDRGGFDRRSTDRGGFDRRSTDRLNLSRRPFVNVRPVRRAAALLWVVGTLLLLTNVLVFWGYLVSSREKRAELKAGEAAIATAREAIARRETEVARLDLGRQNEEVGYLNGKIDQRTFSWSQLFDRMAEVLPDDVRLGRLAPQGIADERDERRRRAPKRPTDRVLLTISGQAKSDEAVLDLVDNLFAHPAFVEPNLVRQANENDGLVRFDLTVGYLPNAAVAGPVRPPGHHWKLSPPPAASRLGPAAPGGFGTFTPAPRSVLTPPRPIGGTGPAPGALAPPVPAPAPRRVAPVQRQNLPRGVGVPPPRPPDEGGR